MENLYSYKGLVNLTPPELFRWVAIDTVVEHFGGHDLVTAAAILSGQPYLPTRGKLYGATKGTSLASVLGRRVLNQEMKFRLPMITGKSPRRLRISYTKILGAFIGRSIPIVGWIILLADVAIIIYNTTNNYNKLVKEEDKLW